MKTSLTFLFSSLNQAAKTKRTIISVQKTPSIFFILKKLVFSGHVQWYCEKNQRIVIKLRKTYRGPILKKVVQLSKPSMHQTRGWKQLPKGFVLCLDSNKIKSSGQLKRLKKGGLLLARFN